MSLSLSNPNPRNLRSSGALVAANSDNGVAVFTGYDLVPGDVRSARVLIANTGSVAGRFKLYETDASNDFDPGELRLIVDDISGSHPVTVFAGEIGGIAPEGVDLGLFEPRQTRRFRILVILNLNASNPELDRGAGAAYEWKASEENAIPD